MELHRHTVGQCDQTQRQKIIQAYRLVVCAPQVQHQAAHGAAKRATNDHTRTNGPQHIDAKPAPPVSTQGVQTEQAQTKHHHGECRAVVQTTFAGECEAQPVTVIRV